ncbi:MAG: UPF0223 family protein [Bacilli bacterium]|jgi:uncharacterized protein YktA (UPF0223 family)|nr:UPF0223 family protein [Bacilli bacterium]
MKAKTEEQIAIDIDYETFTTDEIIKIFDFFNLISIYVKGGKVKKTDLIESYHTYRKVLNSISFEKRYNKMFEDKTGIKIYQTMRELEKK